MQLRGLNLNLLVHLDALLSRASVSGAAEELELSQPTVSVALGRLRRHFDDPLLVRIGNHYELSPLAVTLKPVVADAIAGAERVFLGREPFDPAASRRRFTVFASDYWIETMGPPISRLLSIAAPEASVGFEIPPSRYVETPLEGLRGVDGMLVPRGALHGIPHLDLFSTEWRCVVSADNPHVGAELDLTTLAALPWAVFAARSDSDDEATSIVMRQVRLSGLTPHVQVSSGTFAALPALVQGTTRVAVVHRSLAENAERTMGLRSFRPPFPTNPMVQAFWWHPIHEHDRGHQWFRALLRSVADQTVACEPGFNPV
ncbi:LysR family transcriptional regulator [Actinoplanes sp. N902-109]|uniref:LysR family transcriptional regulator n=1 Tax=Actinoplanes sp. (strain N902-109) TaxID=649831 RepID=UPI0003294EAE|nr:LysR family transcriptional regulator [Actinoplanes sp. N902-109]AGL19788.1 LysR family transcriptional regulator [Actinoplanes sp. N902-109]